MNDKKYVAGKTNKITHRTTKYDMQNHRKQHVRSQEMEYKMR